MANNETLKNTINELIEQRREGDYWDFKEEFHKDSSELVHDVMCLANNKFNQDAYLIFGVSDNYEVIGIIDDTWNQDRVIQILETADFAGGNIPYVTLHDLTIREATIKVLTIARSDNVPFYLWRDSYKKVKVKNQRPNKVTVSRAGVVYARNGSKNTDKDKTPSVSHLEKLWKIRFGISLRPADRFIRYLKDYDNWHVNSDGVHHYMPQPEFSISFTDINRIHNNPPDYVDVDVDEHIFDNTTYRYCVFNYHGSELYRCEVAVFDDGRDKLIKPTPGWRFIDIPYDIPELRDRRDNIPYRYYIKNTMEYALYEYAKYSKNMYAYNTKMYRPHSDISDENILFFNDVHEHNVVIGDLMNRYFEGGWKTAIPIGNGNIPWYSYFVREYKTRKAEGYYNL